MKNSFQSILNVIISSLNAPVIFMRAKALRALGQIIMSDTTILSVVSAKLSVLQGASTKDRSFSQAYVGVLRVTFWIAPQQSEMLP
jgi:hypothetical protein